MNAANRVAFNTVIQYVQLVASILIGLITVRLILAALGEVDYGIYDVIGGVIGLLAFISNSLAQSSMRFLSVSIGSKNDADTRAVFSSCIWLHLIVAIGLVIIIELIGHLLFKGYLNIPENRLSAAKLVYHCVTFSLFLKIVSSPFRALVNSHEHFWYTTLIAFLNTILKLLIAILLTYQFREKLVAYGVLLASVTFIDLLLICLFPVFKYPHQLSFRFSGFKSLRTITSFMGWTLLDVLGSLINRQGYAVLLNRFFGPITNTSFALSRQLEGHIYTVSSSAIATMKPQIMKSYGSGNNTRMFRLSMTAGKVGTALMSFIGIPLIIMMPDALNIWLKSYPADTVLFARLMIIACLFEQLTRGLVYANQAVGNIKWFSIIVSSLRILALPISWVCFLCGAPSYIAIVVFLICETIASFSRIFILSKISNFNPESFVRLVLYKIIPPMVLETIICLLMYVLLPRSIAFLCLNVLVTVVVYGIVVYRIGFTSEERATINGIAKTIFQRAHKVKA